MLWLSIVMMIPFLFSLRALRNKSKGTPRGSMSCDCWYLSACPSRASRREGCTTDTSHISISEISCRRSSFVVPWSVSSGDTPKSNSQSINQSVGGITNCYSIVGLTHHLISIGFREERPLAQLLELQVPPSVGGLHGYQRHRSPHDVLGQVPLSHLQQLEDHLLIEGSQLLDGQAKRRGLLQHQVPSAIQDVRLERFEVVDCVQCDSYRKRKRSTD